MSIKSKPHRMGVQVPCGMDSKVSKKSPLRATPQESWGKGSGRFLRPDRKLTTNESLYISLDLLEKYIKNNRGLLYLPFFVPLNCISSRRGNVGSIGIRIKSLYNGSLLLNLEYTKISNNKTLKIVDSFPLQTTIPHFGGIVAQEAAKTLEARLALGDLG